MKIYHFYQKSEGISPPDQYGPFYQRRIELFYTGGDWMQFGFTYFITNAEQIRSVDGKPVGTYSSGKPFMRFSDSARAYFIPELSTSDKEGGSVASEVDPSNKVELEKFILNQFLNKDGMVNEKYIPICFEKDTAVYSSEYPCIRQ
jgi:hypothetical protein